MENCNAASSQRIPSQLPWGVRFFFSGTSLVKVTLSAASGFFEIVTIDEAGNGNGGNGSVCATFASQWLSSYSAGKAFDIPCTVHVSAFTAAILDQLATIPYGQTLAYKEVAARAASGARAVGMACSRNPIPLVIPCHRVIASDGSIGGFLYGGDLKKKILSYEKMTTSKK